ncbi:MAG: ABC transporter ATP-binding protein [Candidatus Helarchaeota archaeon]
MIEIKGLSKNFKKIKALDNISLTVNEGEVFGFLGPNGAGKTTTIRILSCILKPDAGTALLDNYDIHEEPMKIRKLIGVLTENPCIYERLSGRYNLMFFGKLYDVPEDQIKQRVDELLTMFDLQDRSNDKSGTYSKGMKKKLAISRTMIHNPKIIFLDEPTTGLDPKASKDLRDYIKKLSIKRKITIFLSTHNLTEAEYLCDKIAVINKGKIIAIGRPNELSRMLWSGDRVEITLINDYKDKGISQSEIHDMISSIDGVNECIVNDNKIHLSLESAEKVNPIIIKKLISSGIDIVQAKIEGHSLEDIYLSLIKEESDKK